MIDQLPNEKLMVVGEVKVHRTLHHLIDYLKKASHVQCYYLNESGKNTLTFLVTNIQLFSYDCFCQIYCGEKWKYWMCIEMFLLLSK